MVTSPPPAPELRRVAIEVDAACDNACLFCCREGLAPLRASDLHGRLADAREFADEVTFVGGEPTLLKDALVLAVAEARRLGFRAVGVQSHGRHLSDRAGREFLESLHSAGLSDLQLSVHGDSATVHDYHVGRKGAWRALGATLEAARKCGLRVAVTTVLTRSNFRNLEGLPGWLASRSVSAWALVVPRAVGGARLRFESIVPRLGLALPHALRALDRALRRRLPTWIIGAPHCLLGPYRRFALAEVEGIEEFGALASRAEEERRVYAPACDGCRAKGSCAGLDPLYLARFADAELRQTRLREHEDKEDKDKDKDKDKDGGSMGAELAALSRLFVGMGRVATGGFPPAEILSSPHGTQMPQQGGLK